MRRHTDPPWLSGRPSSNGPRWLIAPRAGRTLLDVAAPDRPDECARSPRSARTIETEEADRLGLVRRLPAEKFLPRVQSIARELVTAVSAAFDRCDDEVFESHFQSLSEAWAVADAAMIEAFRSEDFKEGVAHFIEKRRPYSLADDASETLRSGSRSLGDQERAAPPWQIHPVPLRLLPARRAA